MSILIVNSDELMEAKGEIDSLLNKFNSTTNLLYKNLEDLNNYWIGDDYLATKNLVESSTKPFLNEVDGSIPVFIKNLSEELQQRTNDYESIQKQNMREDF